MYHIEFPEGGNFSKKKKQGYIKVLIKQNNTMFLIAN